MRDSALWRDAVSLTLFRGDGILKVAMEFAGSYSSNGIDDSCTEAYADGWEFFFEKKGRNA